MIGNRNKMLFGIGKDLKKRGLNFQQILPLVNKNFEAPLRLEEVLEIIESLEV